MSVSYSLCALGLVLSYVEHWLLVAGNVLAVQIQDGKWPKFKRILTTNKIPRKIQQRMKLRQENVCTLVTERTKGLSNILRIIISL